MSLPKLPYMIVDRFDGGISSDDFYSWCQGYLYARGVGDGRFALGLCWRDHSLGDRSADQFLLDDTSFCWVSWRAWVCTAKMHPKTLRLLSTPGRDCDWEIYDEITGARFGSKYVAGQILTPLRTSDILALQRARLWRESDVVAAEEAVAANAFATRRLSQS